MKQSTKHMAIVLKVNGELEKLHLKNKKNWKLFHATELYDCSFLINHVAATDFMWQLFEKKYFIFKTKWSFSSIPNSFDTFNFISIFFLNIFTR